MGQFQHKFFFKNSVLIASGNVSKHAVFTQFSRVLYFSV